MNPSNLPPGCTDRDIERNAGSDEHDAMMEGRASMQEHYAWASFCRKSLEEAHPGAVIVEVPGNPNITGGFLFTVDGVQVCVTPDYCE